MDLSHYPPIRAAASESDLFRGYSRDRRTGETVARSLDPYTIDAHRAGPDGPLELRCTDVVTARPCSGDVRTYYLRGVTTPRPYPLCDGCAAILEAMGVPIGRRGDDR